MLKRELIHSVAILLAILVGPNLCASDKFPDYPVHPISDYSIKAEQADVTLAVKAVDDVQEQKTYFHTELTPKGYLPVFVVIQNASPSDSFLFDTSAIRVGAAGSAAAAPETRSKAGEITAVGSLAAISMVGMLVAIKMMSNASQVEENVLKKQVQSKTLSPGGSAHGFLYVPIAKKGTRDTLHLRVPLTKSGSDETVVLDLDF